MTGTRTIRSKVVSRESVTADDDWGSPYDIDRIDLIAVKALTNDVVARYSPPAPYGNYEWTDEDTYHAGVWEGYDNGELSGFGHVQFKRASAGAAATFSLKLICKG